VTCSADAGAGNVYEIVTYSAAWGEVPYQISLLFHYGNLGCYPKGAVTAFDPEPFLKVLESMVSTFRMFPPHAHAGSDGLRQAVVHFILSADTTHTSLDVAACHLGESETDILNALTRRTLEDSQACVRVLLCQQDDGDEAAIAAALLAGGVQVWMTASPIHHAFTVGGHAVLAGPVDWSSESLDNAANHLVLIADTVIADGYRTEFARLLETATPVSRFPKTDPGRTPGLRASARILAGVARQWSGAGLGRYILD
jgi:hypothetical protein